MADTRSPRVSPASSAPADGAAAPEGQRASRVRFDWGMSGAAAIAEAGGALVVVDVLYFATTVSVAVERGTAILPASDEAQALRLSSEAGAVVAARPGTESPANPWTPFPGSLRATIPPPRLVIASRNGASIASSAVCGRLASSLVVAACLRNARAVGSLLAARLEETNGPVAVVAAGERWPDGGLRPALEDLIAAGRVIGAIVEGSGSSLSPEARAAWAVARSVPDPAGAVRASVSGRAVAAAGRHEDLAIALEVDSSTVVPVLVDGAFRANAG